MTDKPTDAELAELVKRAKALYAFSSYKKPENIQYVTTLEQDIAAIMRWHQQAIQAAELRARISEAKLAKDSAKAFVKIMAGQEMGLQKGISGQINICNAVQDVRIAELEAALKEMEQGEIMTKTEVSADGKDMNVTTLPNTDADTPDDQLTDTNVGNPNDQVAAKLSDILADFGADVEAANTPGEVTRLRRRANAAILAAFSAEIRAIIPNQPPQGVDKICFRLTVDAMEHNAREREIDL